MKKRSYSSDRTHNRRQRLGVTLSEVLVSIVIMSIGVVLLSTLLPISILRTAQATQMTQATLLRKNAEAYVESNLGMLSNTNIPLNTVAVVDPLGYFLVGTASGTTSTAFGEFSAVPPLNLQGKPILRSAGGMLGTNASTADLALSAAQQAAALVTAEQFAALPDSWRDVFEDTVSTYTTTSVTINTPGLASGISPRNSANPANARYRVVMFDISRKFGEIRDAFSVAGGTFSWQDGTLIEPALPFTPTRARVEVQVRRFTWMMTVNKKWVPQATNDGGWDTEIDLAVFYNRAFSAADESAATITQVSLGFDRANGVANVDDDVNGVVDDNSELGWRGSDDNRTIAITAGAPFLKKGSYMLEPTQMKWYRIMNIDTTTANVTVLLDQDLRIPGGFAITQGVFMKGIVWVYPLGIRTGQQ